MTLTANGWTPSAITVGTNSCVSDSTKVALSTSGWKPVAIFNSYDTLVALQTGCCEGEFNCCQGTQPGNIEITVVTTGMHLCGCFDGVYILSQVGEQVICSWMWRYISTLYNECTISSYYYRFTVTISASTVSVNLEISINGYQWVSCWSGNESCSYDSEGNATRPTSFTIIGGTVTIDWDP
jgi:hypothetical protein